MSDTTPLSPAEAVVLLRPNVANGLKCIKVTVLLLLSKGVLKLEQTEKPGLFGTKKIPHLRIAKEPQNAPVDVRATLDIVRAAQADDGRLPELVKRASKAWGAACLRFVTEVIRPSLIARGLLAEKQLLFIRVYHPTPAGEAERKRLEADLAKAREIPSLLTSDPAKAAAVAAAVGMALLLDDKLPQHFKPLADALRIHRPPVDAPTSDSGSFDFGSFDLSAFDLPSLDTFDSSMSSFDAGFSDGGGGGDSGGGDGGDSS